MEIFWPVDWAMGELNPRLPRDTIKDLNIQMNVGLSDSEEMELWFSLEDIPEHMRTITDEEFINEYVD